MNNSLIHFMDTIPTSTPSARRTNFFPLLLALTIVLSLANIDLHLTAGILLPGFWGLLCVGLMVLRQPEMLRLQNHELKGLGLLLLLPCLSLYTGEMAYFVERLKGFAVYFYSILFGFLFYRAIIGNSPQALRRCFLGILVLTLICAGLERYTGLREQFHALRVLLHPISSYESDSRDFRIVGFVRPKLIWSEPAHLAQFVTIAIWSISILSPRRAGPFLRSLAFTLVAYALIGSPVLILAGVGVLWIYLPGLLQTKGTSTALGGSFLGFACIAAIATFSMVDTEFGLPGERRIASILRGDDGSFESRIAIPLETARNVLDEHPFFGLGISGTEAGFQYFSAAQESFGRRIYRNTRWHTKIHSVLANLLISFGLLGTTLYLISFVAALRSFASPPSLLLMLGIIGLFQLSTGTIVAPQFWIPVFLFTALVKVNEISLRAVASAPLPASNPQRLPVLTYA